MNIQAYKRIEPVHVEPPRGDWAAAQRRARDGHTIYLFCGSDAGGERAAAIYSLVGTAKLNSIDPETYLRYVLERIADHPANRVGELLPWTVAEALKPELPLAA